MKSPSFLSASRVSSGLRAFLIIWIGQLVSLVGSQLTGFALGVWVYDQTRSVSLLALAQIALAAPQILLAPLAGVFTDRWDRRSVMILSDIGAGLAVLTTALLYLTNHLQPWMVIPLNIWLATFSGLMWPAYTASITLLIPKEQYGRANGFVQLGEALTQIAGPALAGLLYVTVRLGNMALIDFTTYVFAVLLLIFFVRIPRPPQSEEGRKAQGSVWREIRFGWDYITARRGLFSLLLFFLAINFTNGIMNPLFTPLILDNWPPNMLGYLGTIMGVGMLLGTLVMSAWGGGKRKVDTLLGAGTLGSIFLSLVGIRISLPLLAVCGFGFMFSLPLMNASSQAIWQAKVAPDLQGRVFALRRTIAWSSQLIAPLLAAPLADYVFKPGMAEGGALASILGPVVGVGSNHGIGVLISVLGLLSILVCVAGFFNRSIRNVETDLPDHVTDSTASASVGLGNPAADRCLET